MRACTDCGQTKPLDAFTPIRGTTYYYGRCKLCRAARARNGKPTRQPRSQPPPGTRLCASCGQIKPLDDFTPNNGARYRKKICKPCRAGAAKAAYVPSNVRKCLQCGVVKPITDYVRIKRTDRGIYRRCRACRNAKARARYWADPAERERQKARVRPNRATRKIELA